MFRKRTGRKRSREDDIFYNEDEVDQLPVPTNMQPKRKKRLMNYTPNELRMRKFHFGSTLSVIDREKFEREFDPSTLNLDEESMNIYKLNPHIRQTFANRRPFLRPNREFSREDRVIDYFESPRTPYQRRQGEAKTTDHWGQRKLLFSEIEFLNLYSNKRPYVNNVATTTVIYAGAAPGTHINFLSSLFPEINWILVDPASFKAHETSKIEIIEDFFTDEMAKKYSLLRKDAEKEGEENSHVVLFISDIRSVTRDMKESEKEKRVVEDMKMQERWFRLMNANAAMFKFCLPYTKGTTTYLKGKLFLPVWGGRTTTETRLVVEGIDNNNGKNIETMEYDHTVYESLMFHFNTVTRTTYFEHNIDLQKGEGLCHCFDCNSEILILREYILRKRGGNKKREDLNEEEKRKLDDEVIDMSKMISRKITISGKRTLSLESAKSFDSKRIGQTFQKEFRRNQYRKREMFTTRRKNTLKNELNFLKKKERH